MKLAPISPIIIVGALVFPIVIKGWNKKSLNLIIVRLDLTSPKKL